MMFENALENRRHQKKSRSLRHFDASPNGAYAYDDGRTGFDLVQFREAA